MEKVFKIETVIKVIFQNSGDYYDEKISLEPFKNIKKDMLNGSRTYNYQFQINEDQTIITEIND